MQKHHRNAFTLIETTLAISIAAVLVTSAMALLPIALKSAKESSDFTVLGLVLEDVRDRVEGLPLDVGVPDISPLLYDLDGKFVDLSDIAEEDEENLDIYYRVELEVKQPRDFEESAENLDMLAVCIEFFWPADPQTGEAPPELPSQYETNFLVTTLTGPDWQDIDSSYQPKIEF